MLVYANFADKFIVTKNTGLKYDASKLFLVYFESLM